MKLEEHLVIYTLEFRLKFTRELVKRKFFSENKLKYFLNKNNIKNEDIERIVKVSSMRVED